MPDLAWNIQKEKILAATEVATMDGYENDHYICPQCKISMIPACCNGQTDYKKAPYFRKRKGEYHANDCDADGTVKIVNSDGIIIPIRNKEGTPLQQPSKLALQDTRPHEATQKLDYSEEATSHKKNKYRGLGVTRNEMPHNHQASTLARIAIAYAYFLDGRNALLHVPNIEGKTYGDCIQELRKIKENEDFSLLDNKIFFAPIRFSNSISDENNVFLVEMNIGRWVNRKLEPYKVRFDLNDWTIRSKNALKRVTSEAKKNQYNLRKDNSKEVYLFFLGQQDRENPSIFHVEDHRLYHYITTEKLIK